MNWERLIAFEVVLTPGLWFGWLKRAVAYLDPGSGSYILQLIIAAIVGAAFVVRMYWGKIKSFLQGRRIAAIFPPWRAHTIS